MDTPTENSVPSGTANVDRSGVSPSSTLPPASSSKIDLYYETVATEWACDDDTECPRGYRTWEDEEFMLELHSNEDLADWRSTFEGQFPPGETPEGDLTDGEVAEVLRRLRARFPMKE